VREVGDLKVNERKVHRASRRGRDVEYAKMG